MYCRSVGPVSSLPSSRHYSGLIVMASLCVVTDPQGFIVSTSTPVSQCSSYVLLDSADFGGNSIWAIPSAGDVAAVWGIAFSLPVTIFLIAWSLGVVLKMFK